MRRRRSSRQWRTSFSQKLSSCGWQVRGRAPFHSGTAWQRGPGICSPCGLFCTSCVRAGRTITVASKQAKARRKRRTPITQTSMDSWLQCSPEKPEPQQPRAEMEREVARDAPASSMPSAYLTRLRGDYLRSSTAIICPSTVLSELSAYCTRAFIPSKSLQGFICTVGVNPVAERSSL